MNRKQHLSPTLHNLDRNTVVAEEVEVAAGFRRRFLGLMGRQRLPRGRALWLVPCNSVHTLFMRFALDLIFCDGDLRVVAVRRDVRPWRPVPPVRGAASVFELAAGSPAVSGTRPGDRLELRQGTGRINKSPG